MAQTKHQIQAILAESGMSPRHRFGQNFMIDQNLVRLVAEAGEISTADCVIEVGPGTGTLTEELLAQAGQVIAVEIDRDLAALLRDRHQANPRFRLIEGDALSGKHSLNAELRQAIQARVGESQSVKLVANLPYNIASPLVIESLLEGIQTLAFTVQKEVGLRLTAAPGSDEYGPLSIIAQLLSRVQLCRKLPPQAFWPAPKIESALMRMQRDDRLGQQARPFSRFVHELFSYRRKTLRKALSETGADAVRVLESARIDGSARCEELTPEAVWRLFHSAEKTRR